ncbi:Rrf2 family transcriptional regulator [Rhizobium sp. P38BS-XIX]|uniref:Rrf2 family transcriptional regulator n=1 Tax=Rhizobium sp. P38BS-XIX TaxID=2726740 RepID=UPI00145731F8|nr:Rrf2 family transcriptional regulator [Rhizobium sp. P38BS-XIX]NLR99238.1 Rrf2 family transcriptional regulator [Rhizobium sp. P38BS-XIX]
MSRDSRLSDVLHILLHIAFERAPVTSETMASSLNTNSVVVRRIMAGLRDRGYVRSEKGHGGGWVLSRELSEITLLDIYLALGSPALVSFGRRSDTSECLVEQAVNANLDQTLQEAQRLMLARFGEITLDRLAADVELGIEGRRKSLNLESMHASKS